MLFNKKDFDSKQRFSIRKLSVGVCSVLLSTLFLTFNEGQTVHASTNVNAADTTTTSVSSNTTNNSSDNNTDKKDDSKVEASSLATAEKHAPIPIAAEIKSSKSEDQTNSASAETDTQVSKSKQAQNQTTTNIVKATDTQAATSSKDSSDTTSSKDNSAQNTVEKNRSTSTSKYTPVLTSETSVSTKTNQSNSNSATQEKSNIKPVTPHADSTEHIAPETYTMDSDTPAYVIAGSDLTNLASKFISNAAALTQSGATFSWVGNAPTATQQDAIDGNTISGIIKVTYKDGTSTTADIESYVEARSQLQPNTFYYVNRVNDTPDFNTADANGNDFSTMIGNQYAYDPTAFSYKILGTLDTSSLGIHWANVQVTDNNTFAGAPHAPKVIGDPYVIKVPYVVQGLKLRDDIPTDANGNPVINAQLATMPKSTSATPTTPEVAFNPVQGNSTNFPAGLWGQYFYQDYALAYALGIKVQVAEDDLDNNGKWKNKPTDLVNTKTNHFAMTFNKLPNATQQEVDVNYVSAPHAEDMYIYNATGKTYMTGRPENANKIKELLADGYMNDKVWVTLADGTYYYEVNAKVNIAQKVNFEFVDEYNDNNVVGETYSQEFVPGVETNLKFHMAMPDGYELGNGASIPSQYTLAAFSQTTPVVQVPIHQKMHFYITFHDEDSNTNLGTVEVSGSAAAGTGGYYPSINTKLTFPAGADAGDYYSVSTSGVPDGVQLVGSYGVSLTNPTADWTTPNYQWENTFSVLKALTGATMTINLKHKIQETQEQQTRKPTVNYIKAKVNADGTYTPDGSAFTSAVLDVYYSRTKSKDLVTKKVTYTPWLWDTKQGQNGYHVESGTWTSLPQQWAAVVADVPTLDGYTAAKVTDTSGKLANQFVFPTWNNSDQGTSDINKEFLAYTENAPIYEARPVHTVLYIPNETQTRTVTENYVYADAGDLTGEEVFSPYKLEIFYKKTGSLNVSTNTITYSGWSWDTDAGDSDTPGFHVISGQGNWTGLGSNGQPSGSSLGINVPTKDGYTAIISAYPAAIYSSTVFGNPGVNSGTGYTNDTDSTWYWRNSLTTYYVPNSKLSKTVTRTINITQPGKETETTVQKSTITRTAHLNVNDSGIAYNDWGTDSMYWYALNVPKVGGYTMTVTKTVNGVTTPIQLVNGQIPAETVNGTSQDTTINITWGAVATATLTGTGTSTYNGQAITNAELNNALKVNVTGPTAGAGTYTLQAGDVEFSTDGTNWTTALPINAGNYQVRLTAQGKNGIIAKYGNNSIIWTQNGQSTITSNATYMINKLADNAVMANAQSGNYEMTYNGAAPSTIDPSKFVFTTTVNGQTVTLDATGLNSSDFTWADGNAPVNVGTYKVVLTDAGLAKIQNAVGDNYHISIDPNAFGTLVIKKYKASAVFSGDPSYTYTGTPVSADDYLGKYSITLNEPNNPTYNLVAGDIEFNVDGNWTSQAPVKVGTYQVRLSQSCWNHIKAINSDNVEWAATASAGKGSYTIDQAKVTADLSGNNSMIYNGSHVTTADLYTEGSTIKVAINGTGIANLPKSFTLEDGDYTWSTSDNQSPVNVGNYTIKLTQAGINKIQSQIDQVVGAGNVVLTTTADDGGSASFEIKQAVAANVQLYGRENTIYNGNPVSFDPTKTETANNFGFHNVENLTVPTFTASDFTWYDGQGNKLSSAPTNAGTYYLKLNTQGEKAFADANPNYTFEENGKSTISGEIPYVVTPAELTIGVSGSASKVFNDKNAEITQEQINNGDIKLVWGNSTTEPTDLGKFTLTPSDLEVVDANGKHAIHANAGIGADGQPVKGNPYKVQLTADAIKRIKQLSGAANYKISQSAKSGEYFIYEHKAELTLTGNQTTVYGTAMPFSPSKYQLAFTNWLSTDLPVPNLTWKDNKLLNNDNDTGLTWTVGDLYVEGYPDGGVPTNVGTYRVKISKQLTDKLRQLFPDYDFSGNIGENGVDEQDNEEIVEPSHTPASYIITPANTTVKITGTQHVKYGESTNINVGDYSISITAPVHNETVDNNAERIYTNVTLAAGDLEFVTVPTNVGTYQVKLSAQGLQKLKDLASSSNYDWTQAADAKANFFVEQMPVTIAVSGQSSVTYGTQDWLNAIKVNPSGYVLTITTENGAALSYHTVDGDLVFNQIPGNVGEYQVELSAQGLANIEEKLGTNYSYPQTAADVTAKGTFTVKQGEVTVTLNGSDGKTYNAVPTLSSGLNLDKYNVTYSATVCSADGKAQTLNLTANDLQIIGNATNVGTYQVELSQAGQEKLEQLTGNNGANYKWTFKTSADYVVKAATASAELSGSNQKTYDGQAATTAEVNSTNGDIIVNFAFPGSSAQSTYALQAGDYTWENKDGQEISAPTNAGTYTIKLSADGITNLQNAINQYAGQGNVTLDAQGLLGTAVYTIKQKTLNVILGNNGTGTDGKTYDGQPAVINTQAANFGVFTTSGLVNGENLNAANLTNDDYEWVDANGNAISAPTNAGTYYISLTANGLKKLQADNPNYAISESGQFTYVISPAEENVTISGSQESTSTSIDNANFTVHAPAGITVPTGMTYEFATGVPSESGVYVIKLTPESIAALEKTNPNYKLNISSDARFTLNATLSIEFEDTQDGNKQVGKTITKTGVANSTINDLKLVVPDNYELAPDQELPTSYTFGKTLNQNLYIKLVHKLNELNPTDPSTNPDPTNKNWFRENGLVKDVTRTINYEGLSTAQLAQIPETQKAQTVEFTRTAKYDLVTGKIVVNSEGSWTAVDGKDIFAGFTPFAFAGYTAAPAKVEQVKVTGNDKNSQITVTYTANNQTGKISYVDSNGKEVGQTALTGKTDQSVAVTPEAPSGWIIVAGQDIPKSVTATATGIPTVTVRVEHSTTIVTPKTPEKDIPTGPVPGDPSKNYEKMESLTASPTRTIVVTDPSGKTTKVTQTVNFTRTATFDEVTGEITYSNWASSEPTEWSEYTAPEVAGYTATSSVSAKTVTAETADETVNISYTANNQTGKISYVDSQGNEVGQTALTGKTDQSVAVTPEAPSGWRIVSGQDIPKSVTATATGIPTVTVKVEHSTTIVTPETPEKDIPTGPVPGDPSKDYEKMESLTASPTRTIVVTDPSGKTTEVTQTVNFTRMATFDEVTGEVTYSDWQLEKSTSANHTAQWDSYTPQFITHYVPSIAEVPAEEVNANTADRQVTITYTPASESQVIRYIDQKGKEISTQIVSGKYGLDTTFTPKLPNNWQAANTIPTSIKIGENGGLTTIVVEAKNEKVQQSKTVTETIHYHTANGKQLFADKEMEVNFFRTGVKNLVTGEITWNNWNKDKESFNEVPSPKVSGYTASPAKVAAQTVTPKSEDLVFNVIYTKNSQTHPTIPENKPNKPQEENVSKQETKTQDKLIHEYGYKKRADGRLVDHTGHVYPASSKVKENGAIYSEKGELLSVGSRRKHELPQTGLH
ncbi:MAG: MBG domain-containing protein, partial [Lactobacillus paragasseri]|nr:MBG domain-containing protein [Lactobacillus paragasseri]